MSPLLLLVSLVTAHAEPEAPRQKVRVPISVGAEVAAIAGPGAVGGVGTLRVMLDLPPLTIELWGGEGYLGIVHRQAGRLGFGLRRYLWRGSYVRLGFAHAHEVPVDTFAAHPAGSLAGTHHGIHHRSGVEVGLGWMVPVGRQAGPARLAVSVDVSGQVYPGHLEPLGTAQLAVGVVGRFGRAVETVARVDTAG